MKRIEINTWERREIYEFFRPVSNPFYTTSFPLDVTALYTYKKAHGISFYYALCWLCAQAVNSVENFRYTSRDGEVFLHDERIPSFTDMRPGSELFYYVTPPFCGDLDAYCIAARECSAAQNVFLDTSLETDALIYCTCLPNLAITAQTCIHNFSDPNEVENNIPRLNWGKYVEIDGRKTLNLSVEVNHRFVDGIHVSRFAAALQRKIDALAFETAE